MQSPIRMVSRKNQRKKAPERLGIEMIFRRSFMDTFKEYVQCSSLPGVRQMSDSTLGCLVRLVWAAMFCVAIGVVCYFLQYTWSETLSKPLIVTMESSTFSISEIDFPAIAICNNNRISKKALAKFAIEEYPDLALNETHEEMERTLLNWGRLIDFSYHDRLETNPLFRKMVEKYRNKPDRIEQIMKMLAPSCQEMLLRCAWGATVVDCMSIFSVNLIANHGHCCTFNYWATRKVSETKRQNTAGNLHGLFLILDPMVDDYAFPLGRVKGFDILILHPAHFADPNAGRVVQRKSEPNMAVFFELKSTKQVATNEVRKYSIANVSFPLFRECLFHDENNMEEQMYDVYSYSSCIVDCRINTIYSLCKCTPYFFAVPDFQKGPVCTFEELKCLNKYREKLYYIYPITTVDATGLEQEIADSLFCPSCLPDCELTHYVTKSYKIPVKSLYEEKDYESAFSTGINMTNKSFLNVYHPLPDANLDRLDVVFYWFEILSSIGGFSGIVIGFSLISVVEIIYFLTVRLLVHFCINYKEYR